MSKSQLKKPLTEPQVPPIAGSPVPSAEEQARQLEELNSQVAPASRRLAAAPASHEQLSAQTPVEMAYAVAEGTPRNSPIHLRGEPSRPGPEQARRFLEILGGEPVSGDATGSGRLQLADWLVSDPIR